MNDAYVELLERQARRGLGMLPDRERDVRRQQTDYQRRQALAAVFGDWIAHSLGVWDWFVNPISFRDRHPDLDRDGITPELRGNRVAKPGSPIRIFVDDPRSKSWTPDFRGRQFPGPPVKDRALVEIKDWLFDLQKAADQPIRWMIAEEFGNIEGRYHCHALVAGVAHLRRDDWWEKAFERFGRTKISCFDPERGGAFYAAKYAAKMLGALHFGGPSPNSKFSALMNPGRPVGRLSVTPSAQMCREKFRRYEFVPRGWSGWRSKR
jgi:hypothetical protein